MSTSWCLFLGCLLKFKDVNFFQKKTSDARVGSPASHSPSSHIDQPISNIFITMHFIKKTVTFCLETRSLEHVNIKSADLKHNTTFKFSLLHQNSSLQKDQQVFFITKICFYTRIIIIIFFLKGQYHGDAVIFKGLKMTFRTKILKKKTIPR